MRKFALAMAVAAGSYCFVTYLVGSPFADISLVCRAFLAQERMAFDNGQRLKIAQDICLPH